MNSLKPVVDFKDFLYKRIPSPNHGLKTVIKTEAPANVTRNIPEENIQQLVYLIILWELCETTNWNLVKVCKIKGYISNRVRITRMSMVSFPCLLASFITNTRSKETTKYTQMLSNAVLKEGVLQVDFYITKIYICQNISILKISV